jgi:hypothetical protein
LTARLRSVIGGVAAALIIAIAAVLFCHGIDQTPLSTRCRFGTPPPVLVGVHAIGDAVVHSAPTRLSLAARVLGFATTPFKAIGIRGWVGTPSSAVATGIVERLYVSTDFMHTVDLRLSELRVDREVVPEAVGFLLRVEIFGGRPNSVLQGASLGAHWIARGPIRWDCDGFLELHP